MEHFTPVSALVGGVIIGLSTTLYLWLTGRYAGISGILRGAMFDSDAERWMDSLFVAGLVLGGALWFGLGPRSSGSHGANPLILVALGGLLVGFGTSLGNGCTSGHGVCGLGRLSVRSLAAVVTFLATGMLTVFVVRHVAGWA